MGVQASVAVVVAAGSALQAVSGFGYASIASPVLAVLIGPKAAVVVLALLGVPLTAANAWRWRRDLVARKAVVVCAAALVGLPLGAWLLTTADERTLRFVIGVVVLG